MPGTIRQQDRQIWQYRPTRRVAGRSALAVGSGAVDSRIAALLRVVGMSVDGADRRARPATGSVDPIVGSSSSLAQIVGDYDPVVVSAARAIGTRGLIGADVLPAMRSGAELINVGRGEIGRSRPEPPLI